MKNLKKVRTYITVEFLDEINEKCSRYLSLLDVKQDKLNKLYEIQQEIKRKK